MAEQSPAHALAALALAALVAVLVAAGAWEHASADDGEWEMGG